MDLIPIRIRLRNSDKKDAENVVADHLSRLVVESSFNSFPSLKTFSDKQLMSVSHSTVLWYADTVNYLVTKQMPELSTKKNNCVS